ncbi:integrase [Rhizobium sp. NTR19]|uniref:Integrase n=1 Tax=Neorhizobium turbinariae TaxID=2937795 RepID=A0ABT0ISD8_9HYPH|nr:integrase [Neorhizobium turbinariae]MCK8780803.1 integrase [Neorhizobium turbinariae]
MIDEPPLEFDSPVVPMYYLGDASRILIDDQPYLLVQQDMKRTVLRNRFGFDEEFTHQQIFAIQAARRLKVERPGSELSLGLPNLVDITQHKLERAFFYADAIGLFLEVERFGPDFPGLRESGFRRKKVSLGATCLKDLLPFIEKTINEDARRSDPRGGKVSKWINLVGPRQFRRLHNSYVADNFRVEALVSAASGPGAIPSKHSPEELEIWLEHAKLYASPLRPNIKGALLMLEAKIEELNAERAKRGRTMLGMPPRELFARFVKQIGKYYLLSARSGDDVARARMPVTMNGLQIVRPGQRVEMDEWMIDLLVLLQFSGLAAKMTDEERELIRSTRIWVTVAIDVATRCILAMRFSARAPSQHSSLAALEMAVSDKTMLSEVIGAGTPWIYNVLLSCLVTDWGSAFRATYFRASVSQLRATHQFTAAGWAAGRGTIESLFKTMGARFMHWFEGRTFGSIVERGPDGAKAKLNIDELNRLLVRAVVDIYHHTPHDGLAGGTPHNEWLRLTAKYGILPPLHPDQRRHVFGTKITKAIGDKGVRHLGIHYNHARLQEMRRMQAALPGAKAPRTEIRVDRFSLWKISFWDGEQWVTADATMGLPDDVSVWEWVGAAKELAAIQRANSKLKLSVLLQAVNDLRRAGQAASARAELGTDIPSAKQYAIVEKNYFDRDIDDDLEDDDQGDLAELRIPFDPTEVGIDAFRHLGRSRRAAEASAEAEVVVRPEESGFAGMGGSDIPDEDGLDFEY